MNPAYVPSNADARLPLPGRQFQRFMLMWHVLFVGGVTVMLGISVWRHRAQWGWREAALLALVAGQILLYLRTFAFLRFWPISNRWWAFYVVSCLGIWLLEYWLDPVFQWVIMFNIGQLFGALPPKVSLPVNIVLILIYITMTVGWQSLARLRSLDLLGMVVSVISFAGLGLFLHKLSVTSSERAQLIAELQSAQHELEMGRQREAELAVLRERERLARDLHDSLGHALVTLSVQLEAVQRLYPVDADRARTLVEEMKSLVRSSMEALRRSLANLRAPGLGDRPLEEALRQLVGETAQRSGLAIECQIDLANSSLTSTVSETIWRTAQESFANAEKHARARQLQLFVAVQPPWATVRVADDGIGLPPQAENLPGHYGLRGLRERVEGLGGALTMSPAESRGTWIEARLPVL